VVIARADIVVVQSDNVIESIPDIATKFYVVIALQVRPVVNDLELACVLQELICRSAIFEIAATIRSVCCRRVNIELWQTSIQ